MTLDRCSFAVFVSLLLLLLGGVASVGGADATESVAARDALAKIALPASDVRKILSGQFVETSLKPSSNRELSIALAFLVDTTSAELVVDLDHALAIRDDPDTLSFGEIDPQHPERALGKLSLTEDAARRWLSAIGSSSRPATTPAHSWYRRASAATRQLGRMTQASRASTRV